MITLLTGPEVRTELAAAEGEDREISEAAARTVASWWQSPGTVGWAFAAWASGAPIAWHSVMYDLHATIRDHYATATPEDRKALDFLGTFLLANRWDDGADDA